METQREQRTCFRRFPIVDARPQCRARASEFPVRQCGLGPCQALFLDSYNSPYFMSLRLFQERSTMRTLLNYLLLFALLLGNLVPSTASAATRTTFASPPQSPPTQDDPDVPREVAATDVFAPYAYWQNSSDAYVAVAHDDALNPQDGATYEAWIFPSSVSGCHAIMSKGYTQGYWMGICNGRIRFAAGASIAYQESVTTILPNVWTHIAVVWDPAFNIRRFFINGDFDSLGIADPGPTGTRELRIGADIPADAFAGFIAEARIWNVARDQADIRRTMHSYVDEQMPGLVAAWPFRSNYIDVIGGRAGTPTGTLKGIYFVGTDTVHPFPLRPATVTPDEIFNVLPHRRDSAATAYVTGWDRALLIGGNVDGVESNRIDSVTGGDGNFLALGTLPLALSQASAAYDPQRRKVYVFGGSSGGVAQKTIYAVDPTSGVVSPLAATLPEAARAGAAVYHPGLGKIFVLGGVTDDMTRLDRVSLFDPANETLTPATFALPTGLSSPTAIYATAANRIFIFGGIGPGDVVVDTIYQLEANNGGGAVVLAPVTLGMPDRGMAAVEDGESNLIYLLGGAVNDRVWAFDPLLGQLWKTPIELSGRRFWPAALYSPTNRHALLLGGYDGAQGQTNVWKFDLGDGPPIKLGHWDFDFSGGTVYDITGAADRIIVGTSSGATLRTEGGSAYYSPSSLGGTEVRQVHYTPANGYNWFLVDRNRIVYDNGSGIVKLWPSASQSEWVNDFNPYGDSPVIATAINTLVPQGYPSLLWRWGFGGNVFWHESWNGCQSSFGLVNRGSNQIWGLVVEHSVCGPRSAPIEPNNVEPNTAQPRAVDAGGDVYMQGLIYNWFTGQFSEADYGKICFDGSFTPTGMDFGTNGDFWVAGNTGVCRYPAATIPGTPGVQWRYNVMNLPTGVNPTKPSIDRDGRVWFGVDNDATHSGGLTVFEVLGKEPNRQSVWTTDYTWLNAPIGSKTPSGAADYDSSINVVYANGERVWSARGSQIYTLAQRWQQIDERNNLRDKTLTGVWTMRGRLFAVGADDLYILQPDGITWENLGIAGVKDVVADAQGEIWIGAADGVRRYVPGGVDEIASPTPAPTGPIHALTVDGQGRVWIGGADGLTLYDRGRFVTTLALPTGGVITSLLADRGNLLWVSTDAGLARFDPNDATWTIFTTENGLPNNSVGDVVQLRNGWYAISHAAGVVQYRGDNTFVGYSISGAHLPLTVDERGRLWAGGNVVDGDAWVNYTWANSGLASNSVADNAADGTDRVWFAHPGGGVSVRGSTLPPLAEQVPLINDITPKAGSAGDEIQILGTGFGIDRAAVEVTIGGVPVEVRELSDTVIKVRLNENNISGQVSVLKNRKRRTTGSAIFCAIPQISVNGVSPTGGTVGVPVTLSGTNFDPEARVVLGGAVRDGWVRSPTRITTEIRPGDGVGAVKVINTCGNEAVANRSFNKIDLSVAQLNLSQGLPGQPLLYARPTSLQHYLRSSSAPRTNDVVAVDRVEITFTDPRNNASYTYQRPYTGAVPVRTGAPSDAEMRDIVNSLHVFNIAPIGGAGFVAGDLKIDVELLNRGNSVTKFSTTQRFEQNISTRVILVPIMRQNYTAAQLDTLKNNTDRNLDELRRRIMPTGDVDFVWSNDIIVPDEQLELDNFFELFQYAPQLDRARSRWNDRTPADALITFGVVEPTIVMGNADGYGLWPDASAMANTMGLNVLDTLCDVANGVVNTLSFGLLGSDDGCHLSIPLYIGWAKGDDGVFRGDTNNVNRTMQSSYLFAHEMGHILNLIKPWAVNGSIHDNLSHSINDEIGPRGTLTTSSKSCGQLNEGFFDWNLSFYVQPGVVDPVVNPISGQQFYPQNNSNAWTPRAKAMMSYACAKYNNNSFFEPVDHHMIRATVGGTDLSGFINNLVPQAATAQVNERAIFPRTVPGRRLHVSGTVARDGSGGELSRVEALSEEAQLSLSFETGYWLVQRSADGAEVSRMGLFPVFDTIHKHDDHGPHDESPLGFFAATTVLDETTRTLELVYDNTVLDSFTAGTNAPVVQITSPTGGSFTGDVIPVTWTATDADGDALEISIDYSADNGATWTPVASSTGSGAVNVLSSELAASTQGRIRVVAGDGLKSGSATSAAFSVAAQPPRPFISAPLDGATLTESQIVDLIGGARDATDGYLDPSALTWQSDRDGDLGVGDLVSVHLSVGTHVLTLTAQNSAGQTAAATVTVSVAGDYDGDSILDSVEAADGLNPLTSADALSDADGDGLSLRMEKNWGTDPNTADSDGDGRPDDVEIGQGSNPVVDDPAPAPNALQVWPGELTFAADLSGDGTLPQHALQITSRQPVTWTLSSDAPWLLFSQAEGQTPGVPTLLVNPAALENGAHTGNLTVSAAGLASVSVPVTVMVTNKGNYCDVNGDGVLDQADVDAVSARVGSNNSQDGFAYRYDLDRNGVIDQQDVVLAQGCFAAEGSGVRVFLPAVRK
ncbi:hypothetical protein GC175_27270 [bacterium]|nr:hypothetical protein [bacterium]